jgi:hypothetical protein
MTHVAISGSFGVSSPMHLAGVRVESFNNDTESTTIVLTHDTQRDFHLRICLHQDVLALLYAEIVALQGAEVPGKPRPTSFFGMPFLNARLQDALGVHVTPEDLTQGRDNGQG